MKIPFTSRFATIFFVLLFSAMHAQHHLPELPVYHPGDLPKLEDVRCSEMENLLKKEIDKHPQWKRLADSKRLAVGIVDLSDVNHVKYAGLNDYHMMYAASLPKIIILLAVQRAIEEGKIKETEAIRNDMKLMISKSSNQAATRMIDLVGYEQIEESVRKAYHSLYDENSGGGLWVGKRYAKSGKRYPDPIKGLSHAASTIKVCSFYYQLAFGKLISRERSASMLEILKDPALHHKFVNTLSKIAPQASIYRKSGSWKNYHADSVLVWGPERRYIMVAIVEDPSGESIIRSLVKPLESILKHSRSMTCSN